MKGKMLSLNELKNMNGQFVYIKPIDKNLKNEEGKAKVIIKDIIIKFRPIFANSNDNDWVDYIDSKNLNNDTWLNIYEWIENNKQCYKIDELQAFNPEHEKLANKIIDSILFKCNYSKGTNVQKIHDIIKTIEKYS